MSASRLLLFIACILFILAAIVVQGFPIGPLKAEFLALLGFASWVLSGAL